MQLMVASLRRQVKWRRLEDLHDDVVPFRDASIDRWHRKTLLSGGNAGAQLLLLVPASPATAWSATFGSCHADVLCRPCRLLVSNLALFLSVLLSGSQFVALQASDAYAATHVSLCLSPRLIFTEKVRSPISIKLTTHYFVAQNIYSFQ